MRIAFAILVPMFAAVAGAAVPAHADPYRWCAQYGGRGATNCYFISLEQCRAAISGNGGFCAPNNFYDGRPVMASEYGPRRAGRRAAR
jgi:hypothetical protein